MGETAAAQRSADHLHVPDNPVRFVTAASLFDGHDAAINIMRRILQSQGAEVIHLGHNRSVSEIVEAVIQEDAQGVAISSYQGGHVEFFSYLREALDAAGGTDVRIFGGGGGVIVSEEIALLARCGVTIFSPQDGQRLGLPGMINSMIAACDWDPARGSTIEIDALAGGDPAVLARAVSVLEGMTAPAARPRHRRPPVRASLSRHRRPPRERAPRHRRPRWEPRGRRNEHADPAHRRAQRATGPPVNGSGSRHHGNRRFGKVVADR